jgi:hypothetical protein
VFFHTSKIANKCLNLVRFAIIHIKNLVYYDYVCYNIHNAPDVASAIHTSRCCFLIIVSNCNVTNGASLFSKYLGQRPSCTILGVPYPYLGNIRSHQVLYIRLQKYKLCTCPSLPPLRMRSVLLVMPSADTPDLWAPRISHTRLPDSGV